MAVVGRQWSLRWRLKALSSGVLPGGISGNTPLPATGSFIYQDPYGQIYTTSWQTVGTLLDITVLVEQPYVWGEPPQGELRGKNYYRRGIVTIHRTVCRTLPEGYELVAEGVVQYVDLIRTSFRCEQQPINPFRYQLSGGITGEAGYRVSVGPHYADPELPEDAEMVWGAVDSAGAVSGESGETLLEFVDVWGG